MDALERVGTNDDVGDAGAVLEDEDGAGAASVIVRVAGDSAVELLVTKVLRAGDGTGRGEDDLAAGAGGDGQGLRRGKASHGGGDSGVDELHVGSDWKVEDGSERLEEELDCWIAMVFTVDAVVCLL